MDDRLRRYYDLEIQHLRDSAGEFAREFSKVAGRLGLDETRCDDPWVERLLEGFAFLAARVHLKLDAEFPRFTQTLLETVYPHYLAPLPSMTVVQFHPDMAQGSLTQGFPVPRGTALRSIGGSQTGCEYRTAHDVTLWPLEIGEAAYHMQDINSLSVSAPAEAAIRIRLKRLGGLPLRELGLSSLVLHLGGMQDTAGRLYEQIFSRATAVLVQSCSHPPQWQVRLKADCLTQVGFEDKQALLPYTACSFQGYRLVQEYFAFPERYMFVEIRGLGAALAYCPDSEMDIIILLNGRDEELTSRVRKENFLLHCAPAINLFQKDAERIHLSDRFSEFQVVPDSHRPLDFEVYRVENAVGYGDNLSQKQEFRPFYTASDFDLAGGAYYSVHRVPRMLSSRERQFGSRSKYTGSEVYLSLVDAKSAPYRCDLRQLAVKTLCTNRDLPLHMPVAQGATDFTMDSSAPWRSIRCVGRKTGPRPSYAQGDVAWRAISHLVLNYLSLTDTDSYRGASALQEVLKLYADPDEPEAHRQIDGIRSIGSQAVMRRAPAPGPIAFARGLELAVTFDERAFAGMGSFLLGAVLERFFAKYVSINSFTETVVRGLNREIKRWPARMGQREIC